MKTSTHQTRDEFLRQILDEARRGGTSRNLLTLVQHLRERGERLAASELLYLQERLTSCYAHPGVPVSAARFFLSLLEDLLEDRRGGNLLDPFGGIGLLGAWLAENLPHQHLKVIAQFSEASELVLPLELTNLSLELGSIQEVASRLPSQYDAIVSIPPINRPREKRRYSVAGKQLELVDDPSLLMITDLVGWLKPKGFFGLVVAPRFIWDTRSNSVRRNLEHFGLHLSLLLEFRPATFAGTSIAFELAIIDRKPRETLFVAEIPGDVGAQKQLVTRMRKRKQGPMPSQGRLIRSAQFHGLAALEAKERYERLARGKGLKNFPFSQAVPQICAPKREGSEFERCEEHPHAVYLPVMGLTKATTRQDELPPNLKSYLQLLVDPAVVLPEYLAGYFNTPIGHALRRMAMKGAIIPRISSSLLLESNLYLPSLEDQRLGLEVGREIQRLRSELSELESKVWQQPQDANSVVEALRKINHEERFSDWLDTLPFPLASILRSYHALDLTPKERYERLLQFFEAFTELCATIHLSAVRPSATHWQSQREELNKALNQQHLSPEKASFGSWRAIAELMASRLRSMLKDVEERTVACRLYTTVDAAPLDLLASVELVGLLQRVNNFRNRWWGHGGAPSEAEAVERHRKLMGDLEKFREIVGTKFFQYQLIEPGSPDILDGPLFRCRIQRIMGSNPQFEYDRIDLITPAKTGYIYLHNPGHNEALELLPLLQMHNKPQPASYFYNRLEKRQPRLVSYHMTAQSDIPSESAALLTLIAEFQPKNESCE